MTFLQKNFDYNVADTKRFSVCPSAQNCFGHKFCVRDTKNVSDFFQKYSVSPANVSPFARPRKHHEQCVRNNVSSFPTAYSVIVHGNLFTTTLPVDKDCTQHESRCGDEAEAGQVFITLLRSLGHECVKPSLPHRRWAPELCHFI